MRIFIVDDNPHIREFLLQTLPRLSPSYLPVGTAGSVSEALSLIPVHQPDLLLLDVELPDGKSFDLLQQLDSFTGQVIFITAYDHFALQAIKYSALDYLLKPIDPEELQAALQKAEQLQRSAPQSLPAQVRTMQENLQKETTPLEKKIVLFDQESVYLVQIKQLVHCQAEGNYTHFHLENKRQILTSKPLKAYEQLLPPPYFFRAHRSHLINLLFFDRLEKKDGGTIYLRNGSVLPIAVRRRDLLLEALQGLP